MSLSVKAHSSVLIHLICVPSFNQLWQGKQSDLLFPDEIDTLSVTITYINTNLFLILNFKIKIWRGMDNRLIKLIIMDAIC